MPPLVTKEKCDGCGVCVFACGEYIYAIGEDDKAVAKTPAACVECFICQVYCRPGAIRIHPKRRDAVAI
ncbi:MAG: 4Fe-4S ferredoxin [Firmicutes bacterium]|nr:4Fe-4S ferredoxin [Bacillota bacterium]